ncbi:MAG: trigger factor [Bacteriovoracaceae bacterium]|nr:trigger factor [Bacteriovoracaceae bacterium]
MSYQVEEVNGCTKKIVFSFESLDLTTEIKNELVKKQKTVSLKGFRKGKAPLSVVQKMYGPQLESEALNSFIQNQMYEAISKEDLRVVGYPNFENMNYEPGKSVSFDAVVEIFPTVKLKDMSGLSFTKDSVEFQESDLDDMKKNYLNSKAEMVEVKDDSVGLDKGLFAVMNFQGEMPNGEKPENMKGEEFLLEIGSGQFIPGFEDQMVGMKKGDKKTLEVTFPADYQAADLQNALVKFEVELLEIKEKNYPEFSDELAKEFGFDSVADFETKNKANLVDQKDRAAKQKLNQEILEKLVDENSFDIPAALVAQQENHLKEDVKRTLSQQGFNEQMMQDYFEKWSGDLTDKAKFQVRSGLILDAIAKEHNIEANEADFDKKLEEVAKTSGLEMDQIKSFYSKDERMKNNLMFAIREEKTFEKIYDFLTIK